MHPVWYWNSSVERKVEDKWIKIPTDVNKEIEKEYQDYHEGKRNGYRGYHCFGDRQALAYVDFRSMQTRCMSVTCMSCGVGSCELQMAFKIKRKLSVKG